VRFARHLILIAGLAAACGPAAPPLQQPVRAPAGADGWLIMARPLLGRATPGDRNGVVLHWERAGGPTDEDDFRVHQIADTLATVEVDVSGPGGAVHLRAGAVTPGRHPRELLGDRPTLVLELDGDGAIADRDLNRGLGVRWQQPSPRLFERPGVYRIVVAGTLVLDHLRVPFRTPEIAIEVAPASAERVAIAQVIAAATGGVRLGTFDEVDTSDLAAVGEHAVVVDLADGARIVLFDVGVEWDTHRFRVTVGADGTVRDSDHQVIAGCVAVGTPIATPSGPRPVELLQPGDLVSTRDPVTGRAVEARVLGSRVRMAGRLVDVDGLRLSGDHPMWRDGGWVTAASVAATVVTGWFEVFDLTVSWPHTYLAAGQLVHNKTLARMPPPPPRGARDPWVLWWPAPPGAPAR